MPLVLVLNTYSVFNVFLSLIYLYLVRLKIKNSNWIAFYIEKDKVQIFFLRFIDFKDEGKDKINNLEVLSDKLI